jgi:hypothetical protein
MARTTTGFQAHTAEAVRHDLIRNRLASAGTLS